MSSDLQRFRLRIREEGCTGDEPFPTAVYNVPNVRLAAGPEGESLGKET
jgi:hypothetical protein